VWNRFALRSTLEVLHRVHADAEGGMPQAR
jgi:hypothetical protein